MIVAVALVALLSIGAAVWLRVFMNASYAECVGTAAVIALALVSFALEVGWQIGVIRLAFP